MANYDQVTAIKIEQLALNNELMKTWVGEQIEDAVASGLKWVAISGQTLKFYDVKPIDESTTPAVSINLPEYDDTAVRGLITGLSNKIGTVEEGKTVVGMIGDVADDVATNAEAIEKLSGEGEGSVSKAISDAIGDLKKEDSVVAGQFVTGVSEEDGIITVSRAALTASDIPTLTLEKISDAGTVASKNVSTTEIGAEGAVDASIPTLAQVKKYVADEVADLEGATHFIGIKDELPATAEDGDICIVEAKEYIYANGEWKELGDETIYATKATTIAGVDLQDNITKTELLAALNVADGAQVNVIESVKVNGTALEVADKAVNVTIVESANNGKITVNGTDVAIHGLGSMAYEDAADFEAAGAAKAVQGDTTSTVASVESDLSSFVSSLKFATDDDIRKLWSDDEVTE